MSVDPSDVLALFWCNRSWTVISPAIHLRYSLQAGLSQVVCLHVWKHTHMTYSPVVCQMHTLLLLVIIGDIMEMKKV